MLRSIVARDDTLLGACFALGEDFGFNPNWLRILFAAILFFSPAGAFAGYAALWSVVAFSRWIAPDPGPIERPAPRQAKMPIPAEPEFPLAA